MKKQIAVLMAAATAVTTVAPALAHADVNSYNEVTSSVVSKVKKALDTTYKNKNANGIVVPSGTLADSYLNSQYMVLVAIKDKATNATKFLDNTDNTLKKVMKDAGFDALNASGYAQYKNYNISVVDFAGKEVTITPKVDNYFVVDSASKLQNVLEQYAEKAVVMIVDKGAVDGASYTTTTNKHYELGTNVAKEGQDDSGVTSTTETLNYALTTLVESAKNDVPYAVKTVKYKTTDDSSEEKSAVKDGVKDSSYNLDGKTVSEIKITLASGKKITLNENSTVLDFTEGYTENNQKIDLTKKDAAQNVLDQIVKFATVENDKGQSVDVMVQAGDTDVYNVEDQTPETIELSNIYTKENGFTKEGTDFVNSIIAAKKSPFKFNFRGVSYTLMNRENPGVEGLQIDNAKIEAVKDGYRLSFVAAVRNANNKDFTYNLKFEITGKSYNDLQDVLTALKGKTDVVEGHFTRLAGSNRYATAIEISKEQFDTNSADSVVIVGGYAQMDGLSAAPLASAKNAPILLADPKTGLNKDTLNEIKRVIKDFNNKTFYIVGGLNSVPAIVQKQLEELGAVVIREAGVDRSATSLAVARRLGYDEQVSNKLFVVGRNGGADAMGVASVASTKLNNDGNVDATATNNTKVSPILVVNNGSLDRVTGNFIKGLNLANTYVIGGENTVSTKLRKELVVYAGKNNNNNVTRIAGSNRYATNTSVINYFYGAGNLIAGKVVDGKNILNGAVFTSGADQYLVDSQTAGSFAAYKSSPIVLTDKSLTQGQIDMMKKKGVLYNVKSGVYQVGGVVSADVMKSVVQLLGL